MKSIRTTLLVAAAVLGATFTSARADLVVYATASSSSTSIFGTLDLTSGQFREIADFSSQNIHVQSLSVGPGNLLYASDQNSGNLYTISTSGQTNTYGTVNVPGALWGLTYDPGVGFYGINPDHGTTNDAIVLETISADGKMITTASNTLGTNQDFNYASGGLVLGPDGKLYENLYQYSTGKLDLYQIDSTTGKGTVVGTSGLGTVSNDNLALVNASGTIYGVDTLARAGSTSGIHIYTIDTTSGKATDTSVTVTGLQSGFTIDTVAGLVVPEPGSWILGLVGMSAGLTYAGCRRRAS